MKIEKRGFKMSLPLEVLMGMDPDAPKRRGRHETPPLTDEDRAAHKRARKALKELRSNPWVSWDYDGPSVDKLRPRRVFIPEETHEEYMERVREWWEARKA